MFSFRREQQYAWVLCGRDSSRLGECLEKAGFERLRGLLTSVRCSSGNESLSRRI